jgi:NADH/NAD ratio-sensing transcriptional regulator Rex
MLLPANRRNAPVRVKRRPGVHLKNVDLRIHLEQLAFFLRGEAE